MGTTLTIYKTKLDISRNLIIENISEYLATCQATYIDTKFQYVANALNKVIKIDLEKNEFSTTSNKDATFDLAYLGNYLKITNQIATSETATETTTFYYITRAFYVAEKTVSLTLQLDTLNTFYELFKNKFTDRTRTSRQHKDRFWSVKTGSYYIRRFYDTNEGFNPQKFLIDKLFFADNNTDGLQSEDTGFYLIDKTPTQNEVAETHKVVNSFLTFDNIISTRKFVQHNYFKNVAEFESLLTSNNLTLIIDAHNNPNGTIQYEDNNGDMQYVYLKEAVNETCFVMIVRSLDSLYHEESHWIAEVGLNDDGTFYTRGSGYFMLYHGTQKDTSTWLVSNIRYYTQIANCNNLMDIELIYPNFNSLIEAPQYYGTNTLVVSSYDKIDTSDYLINNAFLLPYSPIDMTINYVLGLYTITTDEATIDSENSYLLRIADNVKFEREWRQFGTTSPYSSFIYEGIQLVDTSNRSLINLESRLYGSEFFEWGIHFAGQEVLIKNEKFYFASQPATQPDFYLRYKVSNSFSGHFYFKIDWANYWSNYRTYTPTDTTLLVSNDNRLVLYQNNYLDYIKTMQYYDKQALATAQAQTRFNAGSSIANSLIMSGIAGGVKAGIGFVSSVSSQLSNAIFAQINNENAQAQKEASLATQRSIIRSGADADLQRKISGNKLYFVKYSCSDALKQNLARYFNLFGYTCNDYGTPNLQTRKLWNYIECEADFDETDNLIYEVYLNEIKNRFKEGATIIHKYDNAWDIAQVGNNWESWYNEE